MRHFEQSNWDCHRLTSILFPNSAYTRPIRMLHLYVATWGRHDAFFRPVLSCRQQYRARRYRMLSNLDRMVYQGRYHSTLALKIGPLHLAAMTISTAPWTMRHLSVLGYRQFASHG